MNKQTKKREVEPMSVMIQIYISYGLISLIFSVAATVRSFYKGSITNRNANFMKLLIQKVAVL